MNLRFPVLLLFSFALLLVFSSCGWEWPKKPVKTKPILKVEEVKSPDYDAQEVLSPIQKKLREITIDHIEFEEVTVADVLKYLHQRSVQIDPQGIGVNFVLLLDNDGKVSKEENAEQEDDDEWGGDDDKGGDIAAADVPCVGGLVDDIPLGEAVRYICWAANFKYRIEKNAVVIASQRVSMDDMETRIYPVESETCASRNSDPAQIKKHFEARGVTFPKGASILFDKWLSRLFVRNTPENLVRIEELIRPLCSEEPQVLVEVKYVRIPEERFAELRDQAKRGRGDTPLWKLVADSEYTEVVASASVLTMNGQEATIRAVREQFQPDEWTESEVISPCDSPPAKESTRECLAAPQFGDPQEYGMGLRITPNVDADHYMISLEIDSMYQQKIGWTEYYADTGGMRKMPRLKTWDYETRLVLYDRKTGLIGANTIEVGKRDGAKPERVKYLAMMTTSLLWSDGELERSMPGDVQIVVDNGKNPSPVPAEEETRATPFDIPVPHLDCDGIAVDKVLAQLAETVNKGSSKDKQLAFKLEVEKEVAKKLPKVTLFVKDIPLGDCVGYIARATGLNVIYRLTGNAFVFSNKNLEPLETRSFPTRAALIQAIRETVEEPDASGDSEEDFFDSAETSDFFGDEEPANCPKLQTYFSDRGVVFPEGAFIGYSRKSQKLVVKNTAENLRMFERILRNIDIQVPLVETQFHAVEISDQGQSELFKGKGHQVLLRNMSVVPPEVLQGLIASPHCRLLDSSVVTSPTGDTAVTRMVSEEFYPGEWREAQVSIANGILDFTPAYPAFEDSTDIGSRFEVTPVVSPNNYHIALHLNPQLTFFRGWNEFPAGMKPAPAGKETIIKMPNLEKISLDTNVKIVNGQTIFLGRIRQLDWPRDFGDLPASSSWHKVIEHAKGKGAKMRNIYFFITAKLVSPDGRYVKPIVSELK